MYNIIEYYWVSLKNTILDAAKQLALKVRRYYYYFPPKSQQIVFMLLDSTEEPKFVTDELGNSVFKN